MQQLAKLFVSTLMVAMIALATPPFGTWKMNLEKSRFDPGPAPYKSFTLTFSPGENGAYRVTAKGQTSDGAPVNTTYMVKNDGKDYPVTNAPFDSIAITEVNPNTSIITVKLRGKVVERARSVVSGNTMTNTTEGVDSADKPYHALEVFEKQ
jgi:hypothetical protein